MKNVIAICMSLVTAVVFCACGNTTSVLNTADVVGTSDVVMETTGEGRGNEEKSTSGIEVRNKAESSSEINSGKTLIAYFSLVDIVPDGADASTYATPKLGNTEYAALEIRNQVGGDLFAIKTVQEYPVTHSECSVIAQREIRSNARPELSSHIENMGDYQKIYIGFPIWWYQEPMAIRTFLEEYDFSGKTIIPFCTTLGAGVEQSVADIKKICPNSTVLNGLTLSNTRNNYAELISKWLEGIGITK